MTDQEHRELSRVLGKVKGKVAISGYRCSLMNTLYGDWHRHDASAKTCHSVKTVRQESLWTNY
jgi:DNA adenine methylase